MSLDKVRLLRMMTDGISERFSLTSSNEVTYAINLRSVKQSIGISSYKSSRMLKEFFDDVGKKYEHGACAGGRGSRYVIKVSRKELEEWKDLVKPGF